MPENRQVEDVDDTLPITHFTGKWAWLSNFYAVPGGLSVPGDLSGPVPLRYPTVEHAYQAAKSLDYQTRRIISTANGPGAAKAYGTRVKLRTDWEDVKLTVMYELLMLKFEGTELREKLVGTGERELIEGNTWGDREWGAVWEGGQWIGKNKLGVALMDVREALK